MSAIASPELNKQPRSSRPVLPLSYMQVPHLCVSAVWREEDGDRHLSFSLRGLEDGLGLRLGDELALAMSEDRYCVGWRSPHSGDASHCPSDSFTRGSAQCEECQRREIIIPCHRCTGERCANPVRREQCIQPDNHRIYLAAFAPGLIKVGVAREERVRDRVAEQGARAAAVIGAADGKEIRNMEYHCRRLGYPDRVALSTKIESWSTEAQVDSLHLEIERAAKEIRSRLRGRWFREPERLEIPDLPHLATRPRQLSQMSGVRLRGRVEGLYGHTVVVHTDAGDTLAFEGGSLVGYQVRRLAVSEVGQSQLALAI